MPGVVATAGLGLPVAALRARLEGSAVAPREDARAAQLGLGRPNREGASKVTREPDVQHLAASLAELRAERTSAAPRLEPAQVAASADEVRVPAQDRAGRCRASFTGPHAPHRADEDEPVARSVREDERLRTPRVEDSPGARLLTALRVKVVNRAVARLSRNGPGVVSGTCDCGEVTPVALLRRADEAREDAPRPRTLFGRCEADGRDTAGGDRSARGASQQGASSRLWADGRGAGWVRASSRRPTPKHRPQPSLSTPRGNRCSRRRAPVHLRLPGTTREPPPARSYAPDGGVTAPAVAQSLTG
jgi:hypothetical protein